MKKFILSIITLLMFFNCFAQDNEISKVENIVTYLNVKVSYDKQMNPIDYFFVFYANNGYYTSDLFVIKYGNAQEIYDFLTEVISFGEKFNETGVSLNNDQYNLMLANVMGTKYISIEVDGNSDSIRLSDIKLVRKKLIKYCKKNNISLKQIVSNSF